MFAGEGGEGGGPNDICVCQRGARGPSFIFGYLSMGK